MVDVALEEPVPRSITLNEPVCAALKLISVPVEPNELPVTLAAAILAPLQAIVVRFIGVEWIKNPSTVLLFMFTIAVDAPALLYIAYNVPPLAVVVRNVPVVVPIALLFILSVPPIADDWLVIPATVAEKETPEILSTLFPVMVKLVVLAPPL